uniref:fimbrial protein n=1 Tax=Klebsiella sp. TaxID=576 RepID=UPI0025892EA3|nr:fimbrial protein [Klebsiella sp.]
MKRLFLLISLFGISLQSAYAACSYGSTGGGAITVSFDKVLADTTVPVGTILATARRGNISPKTFTCAAGDDYVVRTNPHVDESAIRKIGGKPVYDTGIPGIGFQISDVTKPNGRFIPAVIDDPLAGNSVSSDKSEQVYVWLVKTGPITKTSLPGNITVRYMAGSKPMTAAPGASNSAELYRININLSNLTFKESTCEVKPQSGNIVTLQNIGISEFSSVSVGQAAGKSKNFTLDITCPTDEVGKNYLYWFNPISENSLSKDGVLLNSIGNGASNVGIIIKQGTTPIKFNDITVTSYYFTTTASTKSVTLNADYFKIANPVSVGATGEIKVDFEMVLQER